MNDEPLAESSWLTRDHIGGFFLGCVVTLVLLAVSAMAAKVDRLEKRGGDSCSTEAPAVNVTVWLND